MSVLGDHHCKRFSFAEEKFELSSICTSGAPLLLIRTHTHHHCNHTSVNRNGSGRPAPASGIAGATCLLKMWPRCGFCSTAVYCCAFKMWHFGDSSMWRSPVASNRGEKKRLRPVVAANIPACVSSRALALPGDQKQLKRWKSSRLNAWKHQHVTVRRQRDISLHS